MASPAKPWRGSRNEQSSSPTKIVMFWEFMENKGRSLDGRAAEEQVRNAAKTLPRHFEPDRAKTSRQLRSLAVGKFNKRWPHLRPPGIARPESDSLLQRWDHRAGSAENVAHGIELYL